VTRDECRAAVATMRNGAIGIVRVYVQKRCSHVDPAIVRGIENALGEISIDEALDALDRLEREQSTTKGRE
jgi:hypothetical protein